LFSNLPLFPFCMVFGAVLQKVLQRFNKRTQLVDGAIMSRISGTALDFLVVAAMGTVSVDAIGDHVAAFLILAIVSLLWQVLCVMVLSRFFFQQNPLENALPCFGQSTGVIASGTPH
jgi:ESS family glutamate:Na+ symporter